MKAEHKVSIITPIYNSKKFIRECVDSVLRQTYDNWEQIFVDDNSEDESADIIEEYIKLDDRFILIKSSENKGAAKSRNLGIRQAKGRFIAFLDSDDVWHQDKLKQQVHFMVDNGHVFTYTQYFEFKESADKPSYFLESPKRVNYDMMLKNNYIGCLTAMYDKDYFGKIQMPEIRSSEDWVLWLRLLKETEYAYGFQKPLAYYRFGHGSLSSKKYKLVKQKFDVYKNQIGFSTLFSFFMVLSFMFHYLVYKSKARKKLS